MLLKKIFILVAVALSLSACSLKKKMDKMAEDTSKLREQTEKMNATTGKMSGNMTSMKDTTNEVKDNSSALLIEMRQGDSSTIRDAALSRVISDKLLDSKLEFAGKFVSGFEFQLWSSADHDPALRQAFYESAVEEFFYSIRKLMPEEYIYPAMSEKNNNINSLYAIAIALHKLNPNQVAFKVNDVPSLYDIIKQGLTAYEDYKKGLREYSSFTSVEDLVVRNREMAEYLIQLRYTGIMQIILMQITGNSPEKTQAFIEDNIVGVDFDIFPPGVGLYYSPWTPQLHQLDISKLNFLSTFLIPAAIDARQYLDGIHSKTILPTPSSYKVFTVEVKYIFGAMKPELELKAFDKKTSGEYALSEKIIQQLQDLEEPYTLDYKKSIGEASTEGFIDHEADKQNNQVPKAN